MSSRGDPTIPVLLGDGDPFDGQNLSASRLDPSHLLVDVFSVNFLFFKGTSFYRDIFLLYNLCMRLFNMASYFSAHLNVLIPLP